MYFRHPYGMTLLASMLVVAATLYTSGATPEYRGELPAKEVTIRQGVGNFLAKLKAGKEVSIAYLGGSITDMNGWRNRTTDFFRHEYPQAKINEIHASIGGTGSDLGAFRVGHDALSHHPDLLFVEFATNDDWAQPQPIWRQMEGIVRQTWQKDPTTDIVFAYTITAPMMPNYTQGKLNRAASAMEMLADHYGIPSVAFGPRVVAAVQAGKLVMNPEAAAKAVGLPANSKIDAIKPALQAQGIELFAGDGVHPQPYGHGLYLESITNAFAQMVHSTPVDHAASLKVPFVANNLEAAKMVAITTNMLVGSWRKLPPEDNKVKYFSGRMGDIWYAGTPGDTLKFKFKGTCCKIYDLLGPDGGQVWITVDGKKYEKPAPRFDSFCTYHRIATLWVYDGADGVHEVEITVDEHQPSRQSVAFRLADPEKELASPKYQGTKFWPAQIMLIGDLVP